MKKLITLVLLAASFIAQAQLSNSDERLRIASERAELEVGFAGENTACYKNFLVNNCLDEVTRKRRAAMADLRRQEMTLNKQDRNVKAAEQLRKTEEKTSLENQKQAAGKRLKARNDLDARLARDRMKNAAQSTATANEKSSINAAEIRMKSAQEKRALRIAKQTATAEELKKYKQRLAKAQERQSRVINEKASMTKPLAQPLPVPN